MTAGSPVMIRIFKQESELELWMQKRRALRAVRHLFHLLLVGQARPQAARGRPAGARGPLLGGHRAALREGPAAALARHRLSQRVRPGLRPHRLLHPGARRLLVDRLLCHDQPRHGRDLRAERAGPARGPGPHRGARVPLPHDRNQPGGAFGEPMACVLAEPQGGLRRLRAHPCAPARERLRQEIHRRRGRPGQEAVAPPDNGAPTAFGICEDAIAGIVPLAGAAAEGVASRRPSHRVASRSRGRRSAGRNVRANYAAARRPAWPRTPGAWRTGSRPRRVAPCGEALAGANSLASPSWRWRPQRWS